jgi:hypothetical protein
MANEPRPIEGAVGVRLVPLNLGDPAGDFAIALLLRRDMIVELFDRPWPGVVMLPADARRLADLLRIAAEDVEALGRPLDE